MIDPDHIVAIARETMGTPFRHQGRLPGVGIDCAGVLVHVLKSLGLPHDDLAGYPRLPYRNMIRAVLDAQPCLERVRPREIEAGNVLLMTMHRFTEPMHVAIYTGSTIVHAYADMQRVVEHSLTPEWRARITNVYRITEPADGR